MYVCPRGAIDVDPLCTAGVYQAVDPAWQWAEWCPVARGHICHMGERARESAEDVKSSVSEIAP